MLNTREVAASQEYGTKVLAKMKTLKLDTSEVVAILGTSKTTLLKIQRGKTKPSPELQEKIKNFLGISYVIDLSGLGNAVEMAMFYSLYTKR